jgi:hypothetical protein
MDITIIIIIIAIIFGCSSCVGIGYYIYNSNSGRKNDSTSDKNPNTSIPNTNTSNPNTSIPNTNTSNTTISSTNANNSNPSCAGPDDSYIPLYGDRDSMYPGEAMNQCTSLISRDKRHTLAMQSDGNLVVYNLNNKQPTWSSGTNGQGTPPYHFGYQSDYNAVVYDSTNKPLWASNTDGKKSRYLQMQNDGNVVIYDGYPGNAMWATGSIGK